MKLKLKKWKVMLRFSHLGHWTKFVKVNAKTKRKAMIAAEKAFPNSKADEKFTMRIKL